MAKGAKTGYDKRFPSDVSMKYTTFLNDSQVDAELYALLLHGSIIKEVDGKKRTYCPYENCTKKLIGQTLHISQPTVRKKLQYLEDHNFIERESTKQTTGYFLNIPEQFSISIPIETLTYFVNIFKENVIKVYLYLGIKQKWCQKEYHTNYNFTKEEVIEHCGIKMGRNRHAYKVVDSILDVLRDTGLCEVQTITIEGVLNPKLEVAFWTDRKKITPAVKNVERTSEEVEKTFVF